MDHEEIHGVRVAALAGEAGGPVVGHPSQKGLYSNRRNPSKPRLIDLLVACYDEISASSELLAPLPDHTKATGSHDWRLRKERLAPEKARGAPSANMS